MKWFRHDTDMHRNRKIRKLIRVHGATGYAFWCLLLEKLYEHEQGFQIQADDLWVEDIAEDLQLGDYRTPIRILDTLAELRLISKQLWEDHVIYSEAIHERGDEYIVKRVQETEKKRRQRARIRELSPGDSKGTGGQTGEMSPQIQISDPDPDPDPDPKTDQNKKASDSIYRQIIEIWNREKPGHFKTCRSISGDRKKNVSEFIKACRNATPVLDPLETLENGLKGLNQILRTDPYWSEPKLSIEQTMRYGNGKNPLVFGWAEGYDPAKKETSQITLLPESSQAVLEERRRAEGIEKSPESMAIAKSEMKKFRESMANAN